MFACLLSAALLLGADVAGNADPAAAAATQHEVALEAALRRFRIETYNAYSSDLAELARRRAAWQQVQARWRDAGGRPEDCTALVAWLDEATRTSARRAPLPAAPNFAAQAMRHDAGVDRPTDNKNSEIAPADDLGEAPLWTPVAPSADRAEPPFSVPPHSIPSPIREGRPPIRAVPSQSPALRAVDTADSSPYKASTAISALNRAAGAAASDTTNVSSPAKRSPAPAEAANRFQTTPNAPRTWVKRSPAPPKGSPPNGTLPAMQVADSAATRAAPEDSLNVGELFSRAAGYEVGLRSVESTLLDTPELDARQLAALVEELESLVAQRRNLLLYQGLLPPDEQSRLVDSLGSPQSTIAELASRIAMAREQLTAKRGLDAAQRDAQLQSLEQLSQRLSRLSEQ